jgi:hypothetical protein
MVRYRNKIYVRSHNSARNLQVVLPSIIQLRGTPWFNVDLKVIYGEAGLPFVSVSCPGFWSILEQLNCDAKRFGYIQGNQSLIHLFKQNVHAGIQKHGCARHL